MERNCNSCARKSECSEFRNLNDEQRGVMSCERYLPMDLGEYAMFMKETHSSFMIDTSGANKYFKF